MNIHFDIIIVHLKMEGSMEFYVTASIVLPWIVALVIYLAKMTLLPMCCRF